MQHEDGLIDCAPEMFRDAIERMASIFAELGAEPEGQLKLITKRDRNMMNSWYANLDKLKQGARARNDLYMHPADAQLRQVADGDRVRVRNANGSIETFAKVSHEVRPGVVAMTHGWGHGQSPGMRVARRKPGVNPNVLLPSGPGSFEPLSNQAHMTGIAVEVVRVPDAGLLA